MKETPSAIAEPLKAVHHRFHEVIDYLNSVILGKKEVIEEVMVALLSRGHLLIEDVPGVGKTTLARSLADILDCRFQRISFTSDLMPSDILGISMFDRNETRFVFQEGPIFTNILLADELNRTTPKTQSAFLEAMESGQVTIEKTTYSLPEPFLVMATQNPLEFTGTFPLPISQLDRFLMRIEIGYPDQASEEKMLVKYRESRAGDQRPQPIPLAEVRSWQQAVPRVRMDASLVTYIAVLASKTRAHSEIHLGVSPRATLALQRAAQARALLGGRAFATPDDIQALVPAVWAHRLVLTNQVGIGTHSHHRAVEMLQEILEEVAVPV
jgi:MoxR-like ATPase